MQTEYVVLLQLGEHRQGIFRLPAKAECGGCGALGWVASQAHIPASACTRDVVRHLRISRTDSGVIRLSVSALDYIDDTYLRRAIGGIL